ncbi:hypothetical protein [Actinokineospora sp. NBRC 105648]|uniref:hypothetical protein n=1 Tax=Actinokineospora sp. NBRC 105648 TaxID=3032206 RepID=UPI0024A2ED4A|nr:hypothetical protein [Actinokineospora sp. NBRC 105648]GLZ38538.1 hypothetical protein Acsp05_21620 [Actinokineospora sp. NBRC 105648]
MPITVRNSGGSVSEPVVASLPLPAGVRALPAGVNRFAGGPVLRLDAPRKVALQSSTVHCGAGTGTVTCGTTAGLEPGESVTLVYRLIATRGARMKTITGSLTAGAQITLSFTIGIDVPPVDGVDVRAAVAGSGLFSRLWPWHGDARVLAQVRNTGETTKPVTVTFSDNMTFVFATSPVTCSSGPSSYTCISNEPLAPDKRLNVVVKSAREESKQRHDRTVTVTAVLGTATDSDTVTLPRPHWWTLLPPDPPRPGTTTTTPKPTTTAPGPTTTTQRAPQPPVTTAPTGQPTKPAPPPTTVTSTSTEPGALPAPECAGNGRGAPKRWNPDC